MDLIELILSIVDKFVPINRTRFAVIEKDANKWQNEILSKPENERKQWEKIYIKINSPWYSQLGIAISYLFLYKAIFNMMQPESRELDLGEDD